MTNKISRMDWVTAQSAQPLFLSERAVERTDKTYLWAERAERPLTARSSLAHAQIPLTAQPKLEPWMDGCCSPNSTWASKISARAFSERWRRSFIWSCWFRFNTRLIIKIKIKSRQHFYVFLIQDKKYLGIGLEITHSKKGKTGLSSFSFLALFMFYFSRERDRHFSSLLLTAYLLFKITLKKWILLLRTVWDVRIDCLSLQNSWCL